MGTTTLICAGLPVRIGPRERSTLVGMNLKHAVVVAKDVSVRVVGAVDSVHLHSSDAVLQAERLSASYNEPGSFAHVDLEKIG